MVELNGPSLLARLLTSGWFAVGTRCQMLRENGKGTTIADVGTSTRKMAMVFGAWMDMRQKAGER